MKKRNWTAFCLLGGLVCFGAFAGYNITAKDNSTFELEDMAGDRSYLSDFPLEGYGGDPVNSMEFTIIDGNLDVTYHSYDTDTLRNIREGREIGQNEFVSYFAHAWNGQGSYNNTEAVPTADAKMEYSPTPSVHLFSEFLDNYRYGETITADEVEIYSDVGATIDNKAWTARFPTGLTLHEPVLFTYGSTAKNGGDTSGRWDSYSEGFVGEEGDIRTLKSFSAEVGETVFAVTMPDERCEGTTYIYKVALEKEDLPRYKEMSLEERITDRSIEGAAEPFLPVPDFAKRRIVGLEGIAEKYLAVFLVEDNDFIAEIYDMEGRLIGSGRQTLGTALEDNPYDRAVVRYLQANQIDVFTVEYEEGVSLSLKITDRMVLEEEISTESYRYRNNVFDSETGRMLLWITEDGVEQSGYEGEALVTAVRGDKILLIDQTMAPEKEDITKVIGIYTRETFMVTVLDGNTLEVLYEGRLKNDFWQDDLTQFAKIDNSGRNAYVKDTYNIGPLRNQRTVMELKPLGGRSGDTW